MPAECGCLCHLPVHRPTNLLGLDLAPTKGHWCHFHWVLPFLPRPVCGGFGGGSFCCGEVENTTLSIKYGFALSVSQDGYFQSPLSLELRYDFMEGLAKSCHPLKDQASYQGTPVLSHSPLRINSSLERVSILGAHWLLQMCPQSPCLRYLNQESSLGSV